MNAASPAEQAAALRERGATLLDLGRPQEAMTALAGAMRLDPDAPATFALLGLALRRLGRHEDSLRVIENGLQRNPNEEWLHRLASMAYASRGDLDSALTAAEEAQRLRPDAWQAKHQLIDVLIELRRLDEARGVAEALVTLAPEEAAAHNQMGRIALEQQRLVEAEHAFRRALALDPGEALYHDNVGIVLYHQGRVAAATRFFDSALSADPTRTSSQHNLYGSSKMLKGHSLLPSPKRLLERVSPKAYRYFLHREGESFRMLAISYLVKLAVPVTALAALGAHGWSQMPGTEFSDDVLTGVLVVVVVLLAAIFVLMRLGWLRRVHRALSPSPAEVAFYSNALPIVFNPLWLVAGAGLWLWLDTVDWQGALVVGIVGVVLSGRRIARQMRGWRFALASRTWEWRRRQSARARAAFERSPAARPLRWLARIARLPFVWLPAAFGIAQLPGDDSIFRPFAGLVVVMALFATLFVALRAIRNLGPVRRFGAWSSALLNRRI